MFLIHIRKDFVSDPPTHPPIPNSVSEKISRLCFSCSMTLPGQTSKPHNKYGYLPATKQGNTVSSNFQYERKTRRVSKVIWSLQLSLCRYYLCILINTESAPGGAHGAMNIWREEPGRIIECLIHHVDPSFFPCYHL